MAKSGIVGGTTLPTAAKTSINLATFKIILYLSKFFNLSLSNFLAFLDLESTFQMGRMISADSGP